MWRSAESSSSSTPAEAMRRTALRRGGASGQPGRTDAVGRVERGDLVRLRERGVVEDRRLEEVEPAGSLCHDRLADVDELRRSGADDVDAEDRRLHRVDDQLQHAVLVA